MPVTLGASNSDVCRWLKEGVFEVVEGRVYKNGREIPQRLNKRKGSNNGDPRVDLYHEAKRKSCHVSQLVWMQSSGVPIPQGFEIHHRDENPLNNQWDNLICVHSLDHIKLHIPTEEIPF